MSVNNRPSLDVLVPLVMMENNFEIENNENSSCESPKEVLRDFQSGDIVLVRLESHCLPAIVFNISGLVMKLDIDRQLYHICLLDKDFTERWVDATDMIIYTVPMIAECQNEETMLMWSTANELLNISNSHQEKTRMEEFKRRFSEIRNQQLPRLSLNNSRQSRKSNPTIEKVTSQSIIFSSLTTCEELHIIDSIHQFPQCSYADAKRLAEEAYTKITCINNRENHHSYSIENVPERWFLTFAIRQIDYLRKYASTWLSDLQGMMENIDHDTELHSFISLLKQSV